MKLDVCVTRLLLVFLRILSVAVSSLAAVGARGLDAYEETWYVMS